MSYNGKEYYININETIFDGIENRDTDGICIYINFIETLAFLSHSSFSNCVYNHGAIYASYANVISMNYVCFSADSGYKGPHFCDSRVYNFSALLINYTNDQSNHDEHGAMLAGKVNTHFCYNNLTEASTSENSLWHYIDSSKSPNTKYCQMSNSRGKYLSGTNSIKSVYILKLFNYLNCTASEMICRYSDTDLLTYSECIFFLKSKILLGSGCVYKNCYSDGSVVTDGISKGGKQIDISFLSYAQCFKNMCNYHITYRTKFSNKIFIIRSTLALSLLAIQDVAKWQYG